MIWCKGLNERCKGLRGLRGPSPLLVALEKNDPFRPSKRYQLVIKQLPDSCQEVVRKFSGTHQTLVRHSSGSRQAVKRSVQPVVMIKIWSKIDFDIHGWLTIENWLT